MSLPQAMAAFEPDEARAEILQIMPAPGWYWCSCWGDSADAAYFQWAPIVGWALIRHYDRRLRSFENDIEPVVFADAGGWIWSEWEAIGRASNEVGIVSSVTEDAGRAAIETVLREDLATRLADLARKRGLDK